MRHGIRHIFIVGSAVLALAASSALLPSVADAHGGGHGGAGHGGGGHFAGGGHGGHFAGGHFGGRGGRGYGYGGGGYYGGGYCGPIQIAAGLCGPY
jgi:hypothetical protein